MISADAGRSSNNRSYKLSSLSYLSEGGRADPCRNVCSLSNGRLQTTMPKARAKLRFFQPLCVAWFDLRLCCSGSSKLLGRDLSFPCGRPMPTHQYRLRRHLHSDTPHAPVSHLSLPESS